MLKRPKTVKKYRHLTASEVSIGAEVYPVYCGRPVGPAGKTIPSQTVTRIGRKWITLSGGTRALSDGQGLWGVTREDVNQDPHHLWSCQEIAAGRM